MRIPVARQQHEGDPPLSQDDLPYRSIDRLLEELSQLARQTPSTESFYHSALSRTYSVASGLACVLWKSTADEEFRLSDASPPNFVPDELAMSPPHHELLRRVAAPNNLRSSVAQAPWMIESSENRSVGCISLFASFVVDRVERGVLELVISETVEGQERASSSRLIEAVAEICEEFERNRRLADYQEKESRWRQFERLTCQLHESADFTATAFRVANDGRAFVGCDRVSVARATGHKCRVVAVSGLDAIERRAPELRLLEDLAAAAVAMGEEIWSDHDSKNLPPQTVQKLEAYLDVSHVRLLAVIPVPRCEANDKKQEEPVGVVLIENFTNAPSDEQRGAIPALVEQSGTALRRAAAHEMQPFATHARAAVRALSSRLLATSATRLVVTLIIGALCAGAFLIETDLTILARGVVEPLHMSEVFAPEDGVVQRIHVVHGQEVRNKEMLLTLSSPALESENQRLVGQIQTVIQQLASVEAERLASGGASSQSKRAQLLKTSEEQELKEQLVGLHTQQAILQSRIDSLDVVSPRAGKIVTWQPHDRLGTRPVRMGQRLLTVAQTEGPWVLKLEVSENDVAIVHHAQTSQGPALSVGYVLATDVISARTGRLRDVAAVAQANGTAERTVAVRVDIDSAEDALPGATALAKIYCGRYPIGSVWLRRLRAAWWSIWNF